MKKITLYLMSLKGLNVLETITKYSNSIIFYVVIGKDKNVQNDFSSEIEEFCIKNKIIYAFRNNIPESFKSVNYSIAISWRWLIENEKVIVFHDSLLPKYRGFAPLVNSLINGEKKVGVTALIANSDYDMGNIIYQKSLNIEYPIKIEKVINLISNIYIIVFEKIINMIIGELDLKGKPQNENNASYSLWLNEDDYFIDWNSDSNLIARKIDACSYPYNFAKAKLNGRIIKIVNAKSIDDVYIENRQVGKVIFIKDNQPIIVCKSGLIQLMESYYLDDNTSILPLKNFRIKFE